MIRRPAPRQSIFAIDTVHVDGFEFRCQSIKAQSRGRKPSRVNDRKSVGAAAGAAGRISSIESLDSRARRVGAGAGRSATDSGGSGCARACGDGGATASGCTASTSRSERDDIIVERDATSFLGSVQALLSSTPDKYSEFVDVMAAFQSGVLDTVEVMEQVSGLLKEHTNLLYRFNRFLPEGYRIEALPRSLHAYRTCYGAAAMPTAAEALSLAEGFVARLVARLGKEPDKLHLLHDLLSTTSRVEP